MLRRNRNDMEPDLVLHSDYDPSACDEDRANFDSTSRQTVATFAEFVRQSRGGGTPRLRSGSHPILRHSCHQPRRLTSSGPPELPEVVASSYAPSLSPSSSTQEINAAPPLPEVLEGAAARTRSYSSADSQPPRPDLAKFQEILDNVRAMSGIEQHDPNSPHAKVARRLKALAEEFEREHVHRCSLWEVVLARAFGFPRPDVVETFMRFTKRVQEEDLSWAFLVRFFFLGLKLLQNLSPSTNCLDEQQSELLDIFMDFLMDRLTVWIHSQGGWDYFPEVINVCHDEPRPTSASTPSILIPDPSRVVLGLERIPSQPVDGASLSSPNTTDSSSLPSASSALCTQYPTILCHLPESIVSMAATPMQNRVVAAACHRPTSLNIPRNSASLPSHLSSVSHHSASACTQPSSTTSSMIMSAGLAVAFGFVLGSFLMHLR